MPSVTSTARGTASEIPLMPSTRGRVPDQKEICSWTQDSVGMFQALDYPSIDDLPVSLTQAVGYPRYRQKRFTALNTHVNAPFDMALKAP